MKIVTLAFAVLTLFTGVVQAQDHREIIWLNESERALLLKEMRDFMDASQKILAATLDQDMQKVEAAARPMGIRLMQSTPAEISEKLPAGFAKIGPQAHLGFEDIADEAAGLGDEQVVLRRLADMQKVCVACHAQYQFRVKPSLR